MSSLTMLICRSKSLIEVPVLSSVSANTPLVVTLRSSASDSPPLVAMAGVEGLLTMRGGRLSSAPEWNWPCSVFGLN